MTNLRARLLASFYAMGYTANARGPIDLSQTTEYEFGAGANAGQKLYLSASASISASATTTLNFNTGLQDAFGDDLALSALKAVCVINTGTVAITLGGTCPIVAAISIKAGGSYQVTTPTAAGYFASAGVAGTITLTNESGSTAAAYSIAALGID